MPRPRKNLPKDAIAIIRDCASRGVNETDIARALSMDYRTWVRLRDENAEAKRAYAEARAIERGNLVGKLYEKAMQGDGPAAMFLLKARHGYRDNGPTDDRDPRVNITLALPPALDPEQYRRVIEQQQAQAAIGQGNG